jgi:hypothetical protein
MCLGNGDELSERKIAFLVSVEDSIIPDYDSNDTQGGDRFIDNIEDLLIDNDFDRNDIKKVSNPTKVEFLTKFENELKSLKENDFMVFYFYGHGGQLYDVSGDEIFDNPNDNEDETLIMYDDVVLDDEIYNILLSQKVKARVLFIIESCNSGSSIKLSKDFEDGIITTHDIVLEFNQKPVLDIIYVGATRDGTSVPSNLFNKVFIETFEEETYDSYKDFFIELAKQMLKKEIAISVGFTMASQDFINQPPLN